MKERSDRDLVAFLNETEPQNIFGLLELMKTFWQFDVDYLLEKYRTADNLPTPGSSERNELSEEVVKILRYFGSHGIGYILRKIFKEEAGIHYHEILRDVAKLLNKHVKSKVSIPRVAFVADYEMIVCTSILKIQFQGKSEEEIRQIFEESGLDEESAKKASKEIAAFAIAGGSLITLVKVLGKKTIMEIIKRVLIWYVAKIMGKEAAERFATQILKQLAQKTLSRIVSLVGWALLAWDVVVNLPGPASRITIPCVSLISSLRMIKRMEEG